MTRAGTLALVESPAQLLNVIELAHTDSELRGLRIAVLAPTAGHTRRQLRAMMGLARQAGHPVVWHEPRLGGPSVARMVRALTGELAGVDRLVVGDPFSGVIQVIISVTRATQVTIVDDGTATIEFARQWAAGEHLSRWHRVATPQQRRHITALARDQIAGTVRRRLSKTAGCELRIFTCMPVDVPQVKVLGNDYPWTREHFGVPEVLPGCDLVGSSLVENDVVRAEPYLAAVESLITGSGVSRYFAHRLEAGWKLDLIARMGVEVLRPDLPLELVARRGPIGRLIVSFPSTVVHTLPTVLGGTGVEVAVCDIPAAWYVSKVSDQAGLFLGAVNTSARLRHGLAAVAS